MKKVILVALLIISTCCLILQEKEPAVFISKANTLIVDKTNRVKPEEIECINNVITENVPELGKYLDNFHAVFVESNFESSIDGATLYGVYMCNGSNYAKISMRHQSCTSKTSYIHEFIHHALRYTVDHCDSGHKFKKLWGSLGLVDILKIDAVQKCCGEAYFVE